MTTEPLPPPVADQDGPMKLATEIVVAYLQQASISPAELPRLVREVRAALIEDPQPARPAAESGERREGPAQPAPAAVRRVSVEESITPDYLINFEDGRPYRSLRRHLMARYGMTPDDYRRKWDLPPDYPMVAPNYAKQRSEVAKRSGLGKTKAPAKPTVRKR